MQFESVLMRWMNLEPIIQSDVSQKEKDKQRILTHICSNYHTVALISQASKVMLKILQARLQQYVIHEHGIFLHLLVSSLISFTSVLQFSICRSLVYLVSTRKKQESSRKTSTYALLTMPKSLTVWITINCGKFFKRWEYQTT